ncbi:ETC complex I subunit region [Candidatus Terasakiella magnetica]|uniref:ETC complex I subunit region n=1 Tax=Candidatus Terasakiella magnetica TaxID=1867952 RepID=A0A1C3RCJ3_9PROT|nr:ETC complex I subunit [Candidatus Terasakiella magnetica]SCA54968.1 ETC complex I subunit region [Candidatus Terasakiella magnetica]
MDVRIYQPAKNAMQSGHAKTNTWILEFNPIAAERADELMGWSGGGDTRKQLQMKFSSKENAITFAEKKNLSYEVKEPKARKLQIKNYADNFALDRII